MVHEEEVQEAQVPNISVHVLHEFEEKNVDWPFTSEQLLQDVELLHEAQLVGQLTQVLLVKYWFDEQFGVVIVQAEPEFVYPELQDVHWLAPVQEEQFETQSEQVLFEFK